MALMPGRLQEILVIVLLLVVDAHAVASQVEIPPEKGRVVVGQTVQISADVPDRPHVEPFVAVDPQDPSHLVAASMAFTRADEMFTCVAFTSFDGGSTWKRSPLPGLERSDFSADPWVAFGPDGTVYLSCLRDTGGPLDVVVYRSLDGGRSWKPPAVVPRGAGSSWDHPVVAVDMTGGDSQGTVYVAGIQAWKSSAIPFLVSLSLARSLDGGRTFEPPVTLVPSSLNLNIGGLAVLADGTVVLPFFDFQSTRSWLRSTRMWTVRGTNRGEELSWPYFVAEKGGGFFPSLVTDPSGKNLILVWTRTMNEPGSIVLTRSSDGGRTWSLPVPVDHAPETALRLIPSVAVDTVGTVAVAWLDDRHADGANCLDLYVALSHDGGRTFSPGARVTREPACPSVEANLVRGDNGEAFSVTARWRFGGDYLGLTAVEPGHFRVVWPDGRTGPFQIWTASVRWVDGEGTPSGEE